MRAAYEPIGVEFAITNSGGLRADLTCPSPDIPGDFCPDYAPPPFLITRGQSLALLPFGNIVVTLEVNGAELKTMLENGVSASVGPAPGFLPSAQGPLPAGIRSLLLVRRRRSVRKPGDRRCSSGGRRVVHGRSDRPDRRIDVHDRRERLHGERR